MTRDDAKKLIDKYDTAYGALTTAVQYPKMSRYSVDEANHMLSDALEKLLAALTAPTELLGRLKSLPRYDILPADPNGVRAVEEQQGDWIKVYDLMEALEGTTEQNRPYIDDLHRKIMNIPEDHEKTISAISETIKLCKNDMVKAEHVYKLGCRDTRHAAAEIVVAYFNNRP